VNDDKPKKKGMPKQRLRMLEAIDRYFGIRKKDSSIQTEILAGISTFLALSYIFVVNPAILSEAGMDKNFVLFATITASALATLLMGFWARLPFVLAPGMELNAYVAYFVVGSLGFTWQEALGAVFWSGVIFVILTIARVREKVIDAIPTRMKAGLSLGVGVFLALVALKVAGLLVYQGVTIRGFGSFSTPSAYALYTSLVLILLLEKLRARGAVLISIILTAILCHYLGVASDTEQSVRISSAMLGGIGKLDLSVIAYPKMLSVVLILFLIDFYGSIAKFIGLAANTNIVVKGRVPKLREALLIDGGATILGSSLGTSSIIVYVESAVGIGAGGRTGLTAVICGLLMLACFLIAPFLKFVPVVATTGALLFVAIKLCPSVTELRKYSNSDLLVLGIIPLIVVATFAIDRAMLAGFMIYIFMDLLSRRWPNPYLVGSTILLIIGSVLQMR
jgi:AGZA family xanthine/uracil permease-like MFS transporter